MEEIPTCGRDGCDKPVHYKMRRGRPTKRFTEYCCKTCATIASGWRNTRMREIPVRDEEFDATDYVERL